MRSVDTIATGKPFSDLFPVGLDVLARITTSMRAHGYDPAHPIQIAAGKWKGSGVICDGHTRLRAAKAAGIAKVPTITKKFGSLEEALKYSIAEARDRHRRTDAEIHSACSVLDKLEARGGNRRAKAPDGAFEKTRSVKSAEATASALGVSPRRVERSRAVRKHADLDREVREGKRTLHSAAQEAEARTRMGREKQKATQAESVTVREWREMDGPAMSEVMERCDAPQDQKSKATFNSQKNEDIDWAKWSWNPVTGCLHGCNYCYARDIAESLYPMKFEPALWPARLAAPFNTKVPNKAETDISYRNVFTVSMGDLFGKWVPDEWIEAILAVVKDNPQWNFIFLTKFPQRYVEFSPFPKNAWIGTTVDRQARVEAAEEAFKEVEAKVKFLSVEPMIEPLTFKHLDRFQWLIIGGASPSENTPAWRVPNAWWVPLHYEAMQRGLHVFHKTNLYEREQRFPGDGVAVFGRAPEAFFQQR